MGIEPTTSALRKPRSTAELPRREAGKLPQVRPLQPHPPGTGRLPPPGTPRQNPFDLRPQVRHLDRDHSPVHYHVDGYNLAHWLAGEHDLLPSGLRELLNRALSSHVPGDAESLHVYWDVRTPNPAIPVNESMGWCTAHNVPDADAAIIDAIYQADEPHKHIVVSRDREVTGKSRQLGAKAWDPVDLLGDVGGEKNAPRGGSKKRRRRRGGRR